MRITHKIYMTWLLIAMLTVVAGCQTPRQELAQFEAKYNLEPVSIEYNYLPLSTHPHAINSKIIINATALPNYKACEAEILKHERFHIIKGNTKKYRPHCKKESCLMYFQLHPIHLLGKQLCKDCEVKLNG